MHGPRAKLVQTRARIHDILDFLDNTILHSAIIHFPMIILLVLHIWQVLHVWLQLLQKDEAKGYKCLRLDVLEVFCFLDGVDIQEDVVLLLEYWRITLDKRLDELRQQQDHLTVPVSYVDHFLQQGLILFLLQIKVIGRCL